MLPAKTGSVTFKFDLPPGTYAIDGFHDEIGNGKFKTSLIGLPEEGYLFSNNVRPGLSAPSFASASFTVPPQGTAISISVQYPRASITPWASYAHPPPDQIPKSAGVEPLPPA